MHKLDIKKSNSNNKSSQREYLHVISLGHFCSVASELERIGLRESSMPFDWVISKFPDVIKMIESNFDGFLKENNLEKNIDYSFVKNKECNIDFYHDFDMDKSIGEQIETVKNKYNRRIERFYKFIKEKTLFIRYISSQEEYEYICVNYLEIIKILKKSNKLNEILFIANNDITPKDVYFYSVLRDENDSVARKFLKKNDNLNKFLMGDSLYPNNKRKINYFRYYKSIPLRLGRRIYNKLLACLSKMIYNLKSRNFISRFL